MNTKKSDIYSVMDRGESLAMMEPLLISLNSKHCEELIDLALELVAKSAGFKRSLLLVIQTSLGH